MPPPHAHTPVDRAAPNDDALPAVQDTSELEVGDFTEPATFSLHPPKATRAHSLPPPVLAPAPRPSRPIAVPLDTTALPPLPSALTGSTSDLKARALDHPLLSIVAFAIMVSAAAAPVLRYLGTFESIPVRARAPEGRARHVQEAGFVAPPTPPTAEAAREHPVAPTR